MPLFAVAVHFEIKPAHAEEFLHRVRLQAEDSLDKEDGCSQFDVCIDPTNPGKIFLYEVYGSSTDFHDIHTKTEHFADFQNTIQDWVLSKQLHTFDIAFPD